LIDEKLIKKISDILKEKKLKVSTAESCTGGIIAHSFTNISGSSKFFDTGVVAYSNKAKIELLGVSEVTLKEHGAVSMPVAEAMAENIRKKANVDIGISTTGIAGPTGGTSEKPVGLVYIGVSSREKTFVKKFNFKGSRIENKNQSCNAAFKILYNIIS
jgi:nicotinamide-nucleotide amidase